MTPIWRGIAILCPLALFLSSGLTMAQESERAVEELEARIIYEAAVKLMTEGVYNQALRRFDRIIEEYGESPYTGLARQKKQEIHRLREVKEIISKRARAGLFVFGTLYGTWLGVGTGIIAESAELACGLGLIVGPLLGFGVALEQTREARISDGQASLIGLGGAWGTWQGIGAALVADSDAKTVLGAGMGGGALGILTSCLLIRKMDVSTGEATMINFGGVWGTWFALCGAEIADVKEGDTILGSAMAGGNLGLLTMGMLAPKMGISGPRARLINLGGIVGSLYGLGTAVLLDVHDRARPTFGLVMAGGVLGLSAGTYFTRDYDVEKGYFALHESGSLPRAGRGAVAQGILAPLGTTIGKQAVLQVEDRALRLGFPSPMFRPIVLPEGQVTWECRMDLVRARF